MEKSEIIHKELDLIQNVIERMASNSFQVKKWMLAVLTALIALKYDEFLAGNVEVLLLALIPILGFWYLDAFFLKTERLYRNLYQWVVEHRPEHDDYLYDLSTFERKIGEECKNISIPGQLSVMFSQTLILFYSIPVLVLLVVLFLET